MNSCEERKLKRDTDRINQTRNTYKDPSFARFARKEKPKKVKTNPIDQENFIDVLKSLQELGIDILAIATEEGSMFENKNKE